MFWPQGMAAAPDWVSVAGAAIALVALLRFKLGLIPLIGAFAGAGMLLRLSGLS